MENTNVNTQPVNGLTVSRGKRFVGVIINGLLVTIMSSILTFVLAKTNIVKAPVFPSFRELLDSPMAMSTYMSSLMSIYAINFLVVGTLQLICLITKSTTVGGLVMGYKFFDNSKSEDAKIGSLIKLGLFYILLGFLYMITLGIFWIVDVSTLGKRDGNFGEKWANVRKVLD